MLRIEAGPADLAASRFGLAPLGELEHLLRKLDRPAGRTAAAQVRRSRWSARYDGARRDLDARALRALRPAGWGVDFVAPPPTGLAPTPADDLAAVRATPAGLARAQVRRALALGGPIEPDVRAFLSGPGAIARIADGLERLWDLLVAPDWPHLLAVLERDVLHRADRLVREGWAAALEGLHPSLRWEGGAVVIRGRPAETARLDGRGLLFVPSVFIHPGLATYLEPPWQPAVVYPARGSAALWEARAGTPAALGRLLGSARAQLLVGLDVPASTTELARVTGFAVGAVGDHLRVLRDAGLVDRERHGRSVLYRRTAVGDVVVAGV